MTKHIAWVAVAIVLAGAVAGCDSNEDNDEFEAFEGTWTVVELETAGAGDDNLNSITQRLESQYESNVTFTFTENQGEQIFEIFARRDPDADLNVNGTVQLSSGNTLTLISENFAGNDVFADYRFSGGQLILETSSVEGKSLLDTLLPNSQNPQNPEVRVTLES